MKHYNVQVTIQEVTPAEPRTGGYPSSAPPKETERKISEILRVNVTEGSLTDAIATTERILSVVAEKEVS